MSPATTPYNLFYSKRTQINQILSDVNLKIVFKLKTEHTRMNVNNCVCGANFQFCKPGPGHFGPFAPLVPLLDSAIVDWQSKKVHAGQSLKFYLKSSLECIQEVGDIGSFIQTCHLLFMDNFLLVRWSFTFRKKGNYLPNQAIFLHAS